MKGRNSKSKYLNFSVSLLKILNLWPNHLDFEYNKWRIAKDVSVILSLMPCALPILADFIVQMRGGVEDMTALIENLIALNCIVGMIYMTTCFIQNRRLIMHLVNMIDDFEKFGRSDHLEETDKRANLYSKFFIFYGVLGNIVYMMMPYLNIEKCRQRKLEEMEDDGVPCGLVTRCRFPFRFDYTPVFEIVFLHQFYTCTMVTLVILVLTMLLCGFLMHATNQLSYLRSIIATFEHTERVILPRKMIFCIVYHIDIIQYSDLINEAFSSMMLLHLTLTSLVISVLGFEILMVDDYADSLRFSLHLFGWLVLLLLVCYYGQLLIDESIGVARDVYFSPWFQVEPASRKYFRMAILRAQKPLALSAAKLGTMSLSTFLNVMSSAYSYFTLLLKMKA